MKSRVWKTCRRGLVTVGVLILVLQLLNSLSYIIILEGSAKIRPCEPVLSCYNSGQIYTSVPNNEEEIVRSSDFQLRVNRNTALIYGHFRQNKSFLTIGIPSVRRPGVSYIDQTLTSLIKNTIEEERREIVIALYLADQNKTWIYSTAKTLASTYQSHIKSGFLQIFHYKEQLFPDFGTLQRTFNDTEKRVTWRSKQNIDYAFMFTYCKNMSDYYLQLEDDVTAVPRYFVQIKRFVENAILHRNWFCLEFSSLGFLGKLVRNRDLEKLANFLLMFYWEQPGDLLLGYIKKIKTQFKDILHKPPLFHHNGVVSSLKGKRQFLKEGKTSSYGKLFYNVNPDADIETTMDVFEDHSPVKAYDISDDYFWAISPKEGDTLTIRFYESINITRIYFSFGLPQRKDDILDSGVLKVSEDCKRWSVIGTINRSQFIFDTNDTQSVLNNILCIMLNVTNSQNNWFVMREISIFREGDVMEKNPYYFPTNQVNPINRDFFLKRQRMMEMRRNLMKPAKLFENLQRNQLKDMLRYQRTPWPINERTPWPINQRTPSPMNQQIMMQNIRQKEFQNQQRRFQNNWEMVKNNKNQNIGIRI